MTDNEFDITRHLGTGAQPIQLNEKAQRAINTIKSMMNREDGKSALAFLKKRTIESSNLSVFIGVSGQKLTAEQIMFLREGQNQIVRFLEKIANGDYDPKNPS